MANGLFTPYRNGVLTTASFNLLTTTIKAMFVDHADDTPNLASDQFISHIVSAARVPGISTSPALASKTVGTVGDGVFDAADTTFTALTGDQSESLILFRDTGTESSSNLIARWDTITGLPVTPNGGDVTVIWSAAGILQF